MTTLAQLIASAYIDLGHGIVTVLTGGSTTTAIDTKWADTINDDDLTGQGIFVIRDAGGSGAAPEGEVSTVTGYVSSTQTATFSPALTIALAAGDTIELTRPLISIATMIELANQALANEGIIQLTDTSLTTVAGQSEYTLPVALKHKIDRVQIQTSLTSGDPDYVDIGNWYVTPAAPGSTGLITIGEQPPGYTIKLWYQAEHPRVSAMSDKIAEVIHSRLATQLLVNRALEYQLRRGGGTDDFLAQSVNKSMSDVEMARRNYSVPTVKKPKYLTPGAFYKDTDGRY